MIKFISAPSDSPTFTKEVETTFETITLRWTRPRKPNGIIQQYRITYVNGDSKIIKDVDASATEALIENLKAFTKYSFKIACQSSGGVGPESEAKTITTNATCMYILLFF